MSRRATTAAIYLAAFLGSFVAHVGVLEGLSSAAARAPRDQARVLEFAVLEPPPPPVEEPPPPEPKPKPKPIDLTQAPPPPDTPPPPNVQDTTAPAEPARPVFGVSMSSTVSSGSGFSVRVGNTLMKDPEEEYTPPEEVQRYAPVPVHKVQKMPKRIGECKADYPPAAKSEGIEGKVLLSVTVGNDGSVANVALLSGIGHGLDEAAMAALRACRFQPAYIGERAVTTTIQYTYTFLIE